MAISSITLDPPVPNVSGFDRQKLFNASCVALLVTSLSFAVRAGILTKLGTDFGLSNTELGWITSMAFLGFPVATTLGGFFVDALGMKRFMWLAFGAHLLGILLTVFAGGFWTLFISTFFVGFANGTVEAVCNPLITSLYPENKTTMLNKFHVWFPGGIVIGSLLSLVMSKMGLGWQPQVAMLLIPTLIYGYMFFGKQFPQTERVTSGFSTADMFAACLTPLFLFMIVCMVLTANTELTTEQYIEKLLGNAGVEPLVILAMITGIMAVGRYFGGGIIHRLQPVGVLLMSAILAFIGIFWFGHTTGVAIYFAAIIFALGVCYFWPTMLGFVSENIPKSGALGLSLTGGAGMFGSSLMQNMFIGPKLDTAKLTATQNGITDSNAVELFAGQSVLHSIQWLPVLLIIAFGALYFYMNKNKSVNY